VLDIFDANLNLVKSYVLSENVKTDSEFNIGRPVLEENNIYVAGYDRSLGGRFVVYSLSLLQL